MHLNFFKIKILTNMGKGDIRSRKGKIFSGTFGKTRPHKVAKPVVSPVAKTETTKPEPKAKAPKAEKKA